MYRRLRRILHGRLLVKLHRQLFIQLYRRLRKQFHNGLFFLHKGVHEGLRRQRLQEFMLG